MVSSLCAIVRDGGAKRCKAKINAGGGFVDSFAFINSCLGYPGVSGKIAV
jgi:hypothetical protein